MTTYTLTKTGKIKGTCTNALERAVIKDVNDQDEPMVYIRDVLYGGCQAGTVGQLIYYHDTLAWFRKYRIEIEQMVTEYVNDNGGSINDLNGWDEEDPFARGTGNRNLLAWFSFETVCTDIADQLGDN